MITLKTASYTTNERKQLADILEAVSTQLSANCDTPRWNCLGCANYHLCTDFLSAARFAREILSNIATEQG